MRRSASGFLRTFALAWALVASLGSVAAADRSQCLAAHADAQMLRMKGSLLAAREKLMVCGQSDCPTLVANDCAGWLTEVDNSLSSVVFAVSDDKGRDVIDVRVSAGGKVLSERSDGRALVLDPGTYQFKFEAADYEPAEQTVSMRQSEKNRIVRVQLNRIGAAAGAAGAARKRDEDRHPIPIATYILGGTTLLGAATFAYFGLSGQSKYEDLKKCAGDCEDLKSDGKRDYILADIGLGLAIASLPAAIVVFFVAQPDDPEPEVAGGKLELVPLPAQRGAALSWSARF